MTGRLLVADCAVTAAVEVTGVASVALPVTKSAVDDACAVAEDAVCLTLEEELEVLVLKEPITPPKEGSAVT